MKSSLLAASVFSSLCALANADGIYTKNSPVLQVSGKDFASLIEQSNHTSIVEFYAPWCGHCQSLKPAYEKAAKNLAGLAKVAAVNCDEESNKPLCGRMGVKGFPTLKVVKPGAKKGRPVIEDYQGARSAKAIVDAVVDKIPNHVKKVQDAGLDTWLKEGGSAKLMLFTEKGTTPPMIKALAVDFLGSIDVATVKNKEKSAVDKYGIIQFPTIVLVPGVGVEPVTYDGEMKKEAIVKFLAQVASPNPDPAPKKAKSTPSKAKDTTSSATASADFSKASKAHKSADFDEHMQAYTIELNDDTPLESPMPIVEHDEKPMVMKEAAPAFPHLTTAVELESACLTPKSGNCILVLIPSSAGAEVPPLAAEALASFAEVAERHRKRKTNIFPFYGIPADNEAGIGIRQDLGLKLASELEVIAINMKRKWWRRYSADGYDIADAERFVDAVRLGEGIKQKLPAEFGTAKSESREQPEAAQVEAAQVEAAQVEAEPVALDHETPESVIATPQPASTAETPLHNEL